MIVWREIRAAAGLARQWVDPAEALWTWARGMRAYPRFFRDMRTYSSFPAAERLLFSNAKPQMHDRTAITPFDGHYFYQDTWALGHVLRSGKKTHVDVGSRAILVGMLAVIAKVTFVDIRPLVADLENVSSIAGSIIALPFKDNSVPSLSCLHVAEHIGLGRYGDSLDPQGTKKATRELARVLVPRGDLYFSVPVGEPRVCFNAHRIHSPRQILEYFYDLELVQFSGVDDKGKFRQAIDPGELADANYACGLCQLVKSP